MPLDHRPAPVAPRVRIESRPDPILGTGDEAIPLTDAIETILERMPGRGATVGLIGPMGAGKTTAIAHLAAWLPEGARVFLFDDGCLVRNAPAGPPAAALQVYAARRPLGCEHHALLTLEPWGRDERIEYLLSARRERCRDVLARFEAAPDALPLDGNPELTRLVLDAMIADPSLHEARPAFAHALWKLCGDGAGRAGVEARALAIVTGAEDAPRGADGGILRALQHRPVQMILAGEALAAQVRAGSFEGLAEAAPRELVTELGRALAGAEALLEAGFDAAPERAWPQIASALHALGRGWRPSAALLKARPGLLAGACLDGARWAGIDLAGASLDRTSLVGADLSGAQLDGANLRGALLAGANLYAASLDKVEAAGAKLDGARLGRASLRDASLEGASLAGASLELAVLDGATLHKASLSGARATGAHLARVILHGARLDGADLGGADLDRAQFLCNDLRTTRLAGARLRGAEMHGVNLEGADLEGACLVDADLSGAYLTGARLSRARLYHANLQDARMADVDLEGADLGLADLRGAQFHLGSSRSGLVGSAIASEGSRTGFYDAPASCERDVRPEEVRKANLRAADLRGADVEGVDFYLVDAREARTHAPQAEQLRKTGAILSE